MERPDDLVLKPAEAAAWSGFLRAHAALVRRLEADLQTRHGLSMSEFEVLLHLSWAEGRRLRMVDLATAVVISTSSTTRVVDRLVAAGMVRRETGPHDRRVQEAVLTDHGAECLEPAHRTHLAGVRKAFLAHLDMDDMARVGAVWRRILRDIGAPLT